MYRPHNTTTHERSTRYTDSFKITSPFLLDDVPLIKRARLETKSEEHSPLQKIKCKAKQLLDFLTAFQDKLNESQSEVSKYLPVNRKIRNRLILSNGGPKIYADFKSFWSSKKIFINTRYTSISAIWKNVFYDRYHY